METDDELPAGSFSSWLTGLQSALAGEAPSDVACGTCTACCTSSQFIHVGPDETETLAHIPAELQFPAPGLPDGHVLLGYDENGHCPMFRDNACSIYDHRPATCRTYDCRIFAATGVDVPEEDMPLIARQARRWRFDVGDATDRQEAVRTAAAYLDRNRDRFPDNLVPPNATRLAVLAIKVHDTFLESDGAGTISNPELQTVEAALRRT